MCIYIYIASAVHPERSTEREPLCGAITPKPSQDRQTGRRQRHDADRTATRAKPTEGDTHEGVQQPSATARPFTYTFRVPAGTKLSRCSQQTLTLDITYTPACKRARANACVSKCMRACVYTGIGYRQMHGHAYYYFGTLSHMYTFAHTHADSFSDTDAGKPSYSCECARACHIWARSSLSCAPFLALSSRAVITRMDVLLLLVSRVTCYHHPMHADMHAFTHVCTVYVCLRICMHVRMHASVHASMDGWADRRTDGCTSV